VYAAITARDYYVFFAGPETLTNVASPYEMAGNTSSVRPLAEQMYHKAFNEELIDLTPKECMDTYSNLFVTGLGNLILFTDDPNPGPLDPYYYDTYSMTIFQGEDGCPPMPFEWMCSGNGTWMCYRDSPSKSCQHQLSSIDPRDWRPFGQKVTGCLAERLEDECKLRFSWQLATVVIVFNAVKAVILVYIFLRMTESPLMTMGDAVASFIKIPDETTRGWCLMNRSTALNWRQPRAASKPIKYDKKRRPWSNVVSGRRWLVCSVAYVFQFPLRFIRDSSNPMSRSDLYPLS
jgi:hypothetical protein